MSSLNAFIPFFFLREDNKLLKMQVLLTLEEKRVSDKGCGSTEENEIFLEESGFGERFWTW